MNAALIEALLDQPGTRAFGWALIHSVWQFTAIGALAAVGWDLLRQRTAQARYLVGILALVGMVAAPVVTTVIVTRTLETPAGSQRVTSRTSPGVPVGVTSTGVGAMREASRSDGRSRESGGAAETWLFWVVAAWTVGAVTMSLRLVGAYASLRGRLTRTELLGDDAWIGRIESLRHRLRVTRAVKILVSAAAEVPFTVGTLAPVIVVPVAAFAGLSPAQLESILAHELAHVRRCDYLVNLIQSTVEALLFYHPAVWWVSTRVRVERELCCDDAAVAACGDARAYAGALTELETMRGSTEVVMAANGGNLIGRIQRLLGIGAPAASRLPIAASVLAAACTVAVVLTTMASTLAFAQIPQPPVPPSPPIPAVAPLPPPEPPDIPAPPSPPAPPAASAPLVAPVPPVPPAPGTLDVAPSPTPPVPPAVASEPPFPPPPPPAPAVWLGFERTTQWRIARTGNGEFVLSGDVEAASDGWRFFADTIRTYSTTGTAVLEGHVQLEMPGNQGSVAPARDEAIASTTASCSDVHLQSPVLTAGRFRVVAKELVLDCKTQRVFTSEGPVTLQAIRK
jgi:beta-lactamase regulating signal transducer with metallopeptidase domain